MIAENRFSIWKQLAMAAFLSVLLVIGTIAPVLCADGEADRLTGRQEWKLAKEVNGIRVYSPKKSTPILAFKADTVIEASKESLLALMVDINRYTRWLRPCKAAREIVRFNETDRIGYALLDAGRLFTDRDMVVHAWTEPDPVSGGLIVRYESLPETLPGRSQTIRIEENRGVWMLIPIDENRTRMVWTGRLHPGGWFPTWLLKMLLSTVIVTTVEDIRTEAARETGPYIQ